MQLTHGFLRAPVRLPPGFARNTFVTISSLMPGSLPCGDDGQTLEVHCLDIEQPIARELAEEERVYAKVLVVGSRDD